MANKDAAAGFRFVKTLRGGDPIVETCFIPSSDETATFKGDLVRVAGSAGGALNARTVKQSAASEGGHLGVVVGFDQVREVSDSNFSLYRTHRPADVAMYCSVVTDPMAVFAIQCDDVGSTLAAADIGLNADVIVGTGSAVTGASAMELDTSTKATTATLPLKIVGFVNRPDNEAGTANQDVLVTINAHTNKGHTGTVGV